MSDFPETRDSLLVQVQDPDNREAWDQFSRLYRPVIYRAAIAKGMQDADALDLAQKVLFAVATAIGRWERKGENTKFRHWLSRIIRNAILNALTRQPQDLASGGSSVQRLLHEVRQPDANTQELISLEYRRELYLRAARIVQSDVSDSTWNAFELTVIEGLRVADAAQALRLSPGAIYTARSRVMYRLRQTILEFASDWEQRT